MNELRSAWNRAAIRKAPASTGRRRRAGSAWTWRADAAGTSDARLLTMVIEAPAPVPVHPASLEELHDAAAGCRACDLWERATQTVFGEGAEGAWLMLVGEQPGDREDVTGAPFVGPAGEVLDRGLDEAGIDRRQAYVTNVVKHFQVGTARQASHPSAAEHGGDACLPALVRGRGRARPAARRPMPGVTAAQALIDPTFRVTRQHGILFSVCLWTDDRGDRAPRLDPARSGRRGSGGRLRRIRGGSARGGCRIGPHRFLRVRESLRYTRPNALTREQYAHASMKSEPGLV
jgi:uracil-DNA glycosylase family 4